MHNHVLFASTAVKRSRGGTCESFGRCKHVAGQTYTHHGPIVFLINYVHNEVFWKLNHNQVGGALEYSLEQLFLPSCIVFFDKQWLCSCAKLQTVPWKKLKYSVCINCSLDNGSGSISYLWYHLKVKKIGQFLRNINAMWRWQSTLLKGVHLMFRCLSFRVPVGWLCY